MALSGTSNERATYQGSTTGMQAECRAEDVRFSETPPGFADSVQRLPVLVNSVYT